MKYLFLIAIAITLMSCSGSIENNTPQYYEIAIKATFVVKSNLPFIFTSVRQSVGNMGAELDKETALLQYNLFTQSMEEYKEKAITNKG